MYLYIALQYIFDISVWNFYEDQNVASSQSLRALESLTYLFMKLMYLFIGNLFVFLSFF